MSMTTYLVPVGSLFVLITNSVFLFFDFKSNTWPKRRFTVVWALVFLFFIFIYSFSFTNVFLNPGFNTRVLRAHQPPFTQTLPYRDSSLPVPAYDNVDEGTEVSLVKMETSLNLEANLFSILVTRSVFIIIQAIAYCTVHLHLVWSMQRIVNNLLNVPMFGQRSIPIFFSLQILKFPNL